MLTLTVTSEEIQQLPSISECFMYSPVLNVSAFEGFLVRHPLSVLLQVQSDPGSEQAPPLEAHFFGWTCPSVVWDKAPPGKWGPSPYSFPIECAASAAYFCYDLVAVDCAASFSWWGKTRSVPPPWRSSVGPR